MAEANGHVQTQNPSPPPSDTSPPPPPPTTPTPPSESAPPVPPTKKRKPEDNGDFRSSIYFKIRAIICDLRPSFIEVLNAPDFRNSKAAQEIKTQMTALIELTKELRSEAASAELENPTEDQSFAGTGKEEHLEKVQEEGKKVPQPHTGNTVAKEYAKQLEEGPNSSYMVGGSPIGWNFLIYTGSKPVYYGVTKESVLSSRAAK